ncbi:hypothetical protein BJX62DRAFT_212068, partial [Aspergillus germanicus]
ILVLRGNNYLPRHIHRVEYRSWSRVSLKAGNIVKCPAWLFLCLSLGCDAQELAGDRPVEEPPAMDYPVVTLNMARPRWLADA